MQYVPPYKHHVNILFVYLKLFYNYFVTFYFYLINIIQSEVRQIRQFNILRKYLSVSGKEKTLSVTGLKNPEIIKVAV
mgnify:CR=1 FL=1